MTMGRQRLAFITLFALGALGAGGLSISNLMSPNPAPQNWIGRDLPDDRSARWYRTLGENAATAQLWDVAAKAARQETKATPQQSASWQRLALAATNAAGRPDREALSALLEAYEVTPFPAPHHMQWRVEFAAAHWRAMPDIVQEKTLTQIRVLGNIGEAWDLRNRWCERFEAKALKDAACETL